MKHETPQSTSEAFERALSEATSPDRHYILRLYITGMTMRSQRAISNIKQICEQHLHGSYELEVIDLYQHPQLAAGEQIIAAPTLVKQLPLPLRRIVGDLSDTERILFGLDLLEK